MLALTWRAAGVWWTSLQSCRIQVFMHVYCITGLMIAQVGGDISSVHFLHSRCELNDSRSSCETWMETTLSWLNQQ